jgi:hypothetical protein
MHCSRGTLQTKTKRCYPSETWFLSSIFIYFWNIATPRITLSSWFEKRKCFGLKVLERKCINYIKKRGAKRENIIPTPPSCTSRIFAKYWWNHPRNLLPSFILSSLSTKAFSWRFSNKRPSCRSNVPDKIGKNYCSAFAEGSTIHLSPK